MIYSLLESLGDWGSKVARHHDHWDGFVPMGKACQRGGSSTICLSQVDLVSFCGTKVWHHWKLQHAAAARNHTSLVARGNSPGAPQSDGCRVWETKFCLSPCPVGIRVLHCAKLSFEAGGIRIVTSSASTPQEALEDLQREAKKLQGAWMRTKKVWICLLMFAWFLSA